MEVCTRCGEEKSIEDFPPRKGVGKYTRPRKCSECVTASYTEASRKHRENNREHARAVERERYKKNPRTGRTGPYMKKVRTGLIEAYGGGCACCGETIYNFLALDHINNNGAEDRRARHQTSILLALHKKLPELNPDFQILCHNCNIGRQINHGVCPHNEISQ